MGKDDLHQAAMWLSSKNPARDKWYLKAPLHSFIKDSFVYELESMISSIDDLQLEPLLSPRSRNIMRPKNTEELNEARELSEEESMNVSQYPQEQWSRMSE